MLSEKQYRSLPIDSYSSIKVFIEDRKKYYRQFVLGGPVEDEETDSTIFGSLVDCLQFKPEEFDSRFCVAVSQFPKPQYKRLADKLMDITLLCTDDNGIVTREVSSMLEEAYNALKYDRSGNIVDFKQDSFETAKRKFIGTDVEIYYRQLREAHGKHIVEVDTIEKAQNIVHELRTNPVTRDIMTLKGGGEYEVFYQFPIVGELSAAITGTDPYPLKGLLDIVIVDHQEKTICIYDLKTAWDNEGEFLGNYRKYKYYLQIAVYFYLVIGWKEKDTRLKDYKVKYPAFIVAESSNYKNPLIYQTSKENIMQGMKGFSIRNWKYPGLIESVKDLIWHKETGIWNMSRDNHKKLGVLEIPPFE